MNGPDSDSRTVLTGQVTKIFADGTVSVDFGTGDVICEVSELWSPRTGAVVKAVKTTSTGVSAPMVIGGVRTQNALTAQLQTSLNIVYDVNPAPSGGSSGVAIIPAVDAGSHRDSDGWSTSRVYQGVYELRWGRWRGCYFYGSGLDTLRGVQVVRARVQINRSAKGGSFGGVPVVLERHLHASKPPSPPIPLSGGGVMSPGSLAVSASALLDIPVSWGQSLVDGQARGLMHSWDDNDRYAIYEALSASANSGQLTIDWVRP